MNRHRLISIACIIALVALGCGDDDTATTAASSTTTSSTSSTSTVVTTTAPEPTTAPDPSTTAATDPSSPPDDFIIAQSCHDGSSAATFDDQTGVYATFLSDIDPAARTLSFDVVQWLVDDDAVDAWHEEYPDDPDGPPNGYYIVNENPQVRTSPVAPDVAVWLLRLAEDADADVDPGTFDELPGYLADQHLEGDEYLSYSPYWLRFDGGSITEICEQYTP